MKLFLTFLALFAVSTAGPLTLTSQQELQSIEEFWETVKKIYNDMVDRGSEFVCSKKLPELMDILGLPDQLDGAVEMAQQWLCAEEEVPVSHPRLNAAALKGFRDQVKRMYERIKAYGKDLVCGTKLHDLLDLLGVDDRLDGAVKMAQDWFCDEEEETSDTVKRSADLMPEESFKEMVKRILKKMKEKGKEFVCSAKLNELLAILGWDERLAPAVKYVQSIFCGEEEEEQPDELLLSSSYQEALEAYGSTWSEIKEALKKWSRDKLCTTKLQDLLDILGFPDALDGAVEMIQDAICKSEDNDIEWK